MRIPYLIFVVSSILVSSLALRVDTQPRASLYQPQTYRNSLNDTQTKFENQLNLLNQQISDINQVIQDASKSSSLKVTTLSQKMADQRNSLYNIQQTLKVPYRYKVCECRELSNSQKTALEAKVQDINKNIATLQTDISSCPVQTCPSYVQLQQGIKNMKAYLTSVEEILNSDCCRKKLEFRQEQALGMVDLGNSLYKDNLKADGWYYGTIQEQDYKMQMFELTTKYNVSTCPLHKPFANYQLNKCTSCKQPGAIFNLGVRSCYYCGKLAYLNTTNSICQPCPTHHFYNATNKSCAHCPNDQFLNTTSQTCQPCAKGQFFESSLERCTTCPENQEYNHTLRICRACNQTAAQYYSAKKLICVHCQRGYIFNQTTRKCQICPDNAIFDSNAGVCVPCQNGYYVNLYTMSCEACPADTYFNKTMKKCVSCPKNSHFDNVEQRCVGHSEVGNSTNCPSDHPYYNKFLNRCQQCGVSEQYDFEQKKCIGNNNIGVCPANKPFFDTSIKACVACPEGTKYNPYQYICQSVSTHHRHQLEM